jgi:hypothetical protein
MAYIQIPVLIAFDPSGGEFARDGRGAARTRVVTLIFDPVDTDKPGHVIDHYPPREHAEWQVDEANVLLSMLDDAERTIALRAKADPETYAAPQPFTVADAQAFAATVPGVTCELFRGRLLLRSEGLSPPLVSFFVERDGTIFPRTEGNFKAWVDYARRKASAA